MCTHSVYPPSPCVQATREQGLVPHVFIVRAEAISYFNDQRTCCPSFALHTLPIHPRRIRAVYSSLYSACCLQHHSPGKLTVQ